MGEVSDRLSAALTGRYAIEREIGAGGMATVYLARDLRHNRKVAVKVLRPELAAVLGTERFLSEIQVTANLQHPHLLPLFDSGEADGQLFYVMPFVEGESLRARLERERQLPVEEAVRIARAIAGALDYAHRHGVIHRDLKPENILLHDGQPVVADFGIALAVSNAGGARVTQTGISLGTPAYMSPEQATGDRSVDGRADVYSLAAITYEMLVGDPPHAASTAQALIAKVLTERPHGVRVLRSSVPEHVDHAIQKALEKLPADRFTSVNAFARALEAADPNVPRQTVAWRPMIARALKVAFAAAVLLGAGWLGTTYASTSELTEEATWVDILPPHGGFGLRPAPVLSPDARRIAFWAPDSAGVIHLWVRDLNSRTARMLPGTALDTQAPNNPIIQSFWSPDGSSIGFFADRKLKRIDLAEGLPLTLADAVNARGGTWNDAGQIIYVPAPGSALYLVSASGGHAEPLSLTLRDDQSANLTPVWPQFLPDGNSFVFSSSSPSAGVFVGSVDSREARLLLASDSRAEYAAGHLLLGREGTLIAYPFDLRRLQITGQPTRVADGLGSTRGDGFNVAFSAAESDVVIWSGSGLESTQLSWYDRTGKLLGRVGVADRHRSIALAHDDRRAAVETDRGVWTVELQTGVPTRLAVSGPGNQAAITPQWMPDSRRVAFARNGSIVVRSVDGTDSTVIKGQTQVAWLHGISGDGTKFLYMETVPRTLANIRLLDAPAQADRPYLETSAGETQGRFSPDDRWVAFVSDESGDDEIYVESFPMRETRMRVSATGGRWPQWSRDGRELFFIDGEGGIVAAALGAGGPRLEVTTRRLFVAPPTVPDYGRDQYAPSSRGDRFLFNELVDADGPASLTLGLNWPAVLR